MHRGARAGSGRREYVRVSSPSPIDRAKAEGFGSDDRDVREPLWEHYLRAGSATGGIAAATPTASQDIGEIAVLEDDGTLFLRQNAFDLRNLTLRFERNGSGGYDVTRIDPAFRQNIGSRLTLTDDDASRQTLPFGVFVLRTAAVERVRQLGRQSHLRGCRHRVVHARLRAACSAARRASRRSSPISIRRSAGGVFVASVVGRVRRHLVRRARLRIDALDDGAGDAAAHRRHRDDLWRADRSRRRHRRRITRAHGELLTLGFERERPSGRRRRGGRRAILGDDGAGHGGGGAQVLSDARRQLRSAGDLGGHDGGRRRRVRVRIDDLERDPRHRRRSLQRVERFRQRGPVDRASW